MTPLENMVFIVGFIAVFVGLGWLSEASALIVGGFVAMLAAVLEMRNRA